MEVSCPLKLSLESSGSEKAAVLPVHLSRAQQVCSLQKGRDGLRLDGGGRLVVQGLDGFENFICESQVFEGYERFVADIFCRNFVIGCFVRGVRGRFCAVLLRLGVFLVVLFDCFLVNNSLFDFAFLDFDLRADLDGGLGALLEHIAFFVDDNAIRVQCEKRGFVCLVFVGAVCDCVQESARFVSYFGFRVNILFRDTFFGILLHNAPSGPVNFICGPCRTIERFGIRTLKSPEAHSRL